MGRRLGVTGGVALWTAGVATLVACAPSMPVPATGRPIVYDRLDASAADPGGFEPLVAFEPAEVLPPALAAGPHHLVESVRNDGFTNRYVLVTDRGSLEVETTGLLRKRVHEARVMASLDEEEVSADEVYLLSTANAARGPVEGAAQLLLHPVRSAKAIPTGMWSYARRLVALAELERTYNEDHYAEELIGFSDAKREWAYRLGVDVYTDNPLLQQMLDRFAWLSLTGGLTVRAPLMAVTGPAGYALTVTGTTDQMRRELRDRSPEEIRMDVSARLVRLGVDEGLAERFVGHPWYPPTRLLVVAESLSGMTEARGRSTFIAAAVLADEPRDTWIFARLAIMLAVYADQEEILAELMAPGGLVMARSVSGELVVPLYVDWAVWTPAMARFVETVERNVPPGTSGRRLVVSGWLSRRTRAHVEALGWTVLEGVENTWLADVDAAAWQPGQPDPDRVLPEFGE